MTSQTRYRGFDRFRIEQCGSQEQVFTPATKWDLTHGTAPYDKWTPLEKHMSTDQSPTFQSIFAAIGQKLDADSELKQLFSQALGLLLQETPPQAQPLESPEDLLVEETPSQLGATDLLPVAPPISRPSLEELAGLVQTFKPVAALTQSAAPSERPGAPAPVEIIQARLRIKRDAIAQAVERSEAKTRGEKVPSTGEWYHGVIAQAKALPNCYLWMCQSRHDDATVQKWKKTEACFYVMSKALSLVKECRNLDVRSVMERTLMLLAEAQSMVRSACKEFDFEDGDQLDVYLHLLDWSAAQQRYIARFMKADDLADPEQTEDLVKRIDLLSSEVASIKAQKKLRNNLLGKIRYELKILGNRPSDPFSNWTKIVASVDQLASLGLAPNDAELRSALIDHLDEIPDVLELPEGFQQFLAATDTFLATQPAATPFREDIPTPEVTKAATYLRGMAIVIIGGQCRHESKIALMSALSLSEINWIETRPHETTSQFESAIARGEVKLVLLAIRWSSHSYGDVKKFCDKHGKKLVRLPRGYGVNQVAAEICNQCSGEFE